MQIRKIFVILEEDLALKMLCYAPKILFEDDKVLRICVLTKITTAVALTLD